MPDNNIARLPSENIGGEDEFSQRLKALKAEGKAKVIEKKREADVKVAGSSSPEASLYASPPSIKETILENLNKDISDPALRKAEFGPGQVGTAAGALVLVGLLVFTSIGVMDGGKRFKGVAPARPPPDQLDQAMIQSRINQLNEQLKQNPEDKDALVSLTSSYGEMYKWDEASNTLERLLKLEDSDADLWRNYGDINLLAQRSAKAVKGYERAYGLQPDDAVTLTGLVNAYISDAKYQRAIDTTTAVRIRIATKASSASSASTQDTSTPPPAAASTGSSDSTSRTTGGADSTGASSSASMEGVSSVPAPPVLASSSSSDEAAPSPSQRPNLASTGRSRKVVVGKRKGLDPVEVELLTAKTYIAWRGHDNDALSTYDNCIRQFPGDFRPYQAKGLFLKERGRKADAERMFLQARYYAPSSMQKALLEMQKGPSLSVDPMALPS